MSSNVQSVEPAVAGDRRAQQRETTRAALFEAAIAEFRRVGFAETEIAVIAERVGVARGTFYVHYAGKEAVLLELLESEERRIADRVQPLVRDGAPLAEVLQATADAALAAERRLGRRLTRDLCATFFRPEFAPSADPADHPLALAVTEATTARHPGAEGVAAATVFLTGLFGLMATSHGSGAERRRCIDLLVQSVSTGVDQT